MSFNFQEGKYVVEEDQNQNDELEEERDNIAEINERIFKLHKAIKQKQIEEQ
jgi:hypothetical protein